MLQVRRGGGLASSAHRTSASDEQGTMAFCGVHGAHGAALLVLVPGPAVLMMIVQASGERSASLCCTVLSLACRQCLSELMMIVHASGERRASLKLHVIVIGSQEVWTDPPGIRLSVVGPMR